MRWALVVSCLACVPCAAFAQAHDMSSMPGMVMPEKKPVKAKPARKKAEAKEAPAIDHAGMHHEAPAASTEPVVPAMDHGAMHHEAPASGGDARPEVPGSPRSMDKGAMRPMQGGAAPADARDPDAYADDLPHEDMPGMDMDDDARHLYVLVDRLEAVHARDAHGQALDAQAWYGGDIDQLWLKVDGERRGGRLGATRAEALWNRAITPYWALQTGVRQDVGEGPGRTWASFGVQGLSPYWFDLQATAYAGEGGRTALRFEAEYDLLVTQRLVLQPDLKIDAYGRDDARRAIGAGVSQVEAGLRLRYALSRKFAPYVGVAWVRKFGNTARFARDADEPVRQVEAVAGIRFWF